WRAAGDFHGAAKVNTCIFRIAHHQLAHYQRTVARRPEGHPATPGPLDEEESPGQGVWDEIAQDSHEGAALDRMILARAFGRLAAKHREAVELVYQQG